jgi:subtilisin family serine protease
LGAVVNYVFDHPQLPDASSAKDYIGHGTHVSGTIAARINNQVGVNGITPCQLYAWKIFADKPIYNQFTDRYIYIVDTAMYHRALADCLDEGIDVINLSIGGPGVPDENERVLFEQLLAAGTTVVAAMGNERAQGSPTSYPAAIPGVIAVGATNINDQVTSFSNRGPHISLSAPGDTIWSTLPTYEGQTGFRARHLPTGQIESGSPLSRDTDYAAWNGTSMASPHVAAAAALLLAKQKRSPAEVREALMKSADRVPGMGNQDFHQDYGAGRLNLERLLT